MRFNPCPVVAGGAVVNRDVPDNRFVQGYPLESLRKLNNDKQNGLDY